MFARGRDLGINLVDTAECYGDHLSESLDRQRDPARARQVGRRHEVRPQVPRPHEPHRRADRGRTCGSSSRIRCRRCKTDYIDLYQFHSVADHGVRRRGAAPGAGGHASPAARCGTSATPSAPRATRCTRSSGSAAAKVEAIQIVYNRLDARARAEGAARVPAAEPRRPRPRAARQRLALRQVQARPDVLRPRRLPRRPGQAGDRRQAARGRAHRARGSARRARTWPSGPSRGASSTPP